MERLNDNEVKEVARMQSLINGYEAFILALSFMAKGKKRIDYPLFTDTELDKQMNWLWKWVKERVGEQTNKEQ